MSRFTRMFEIIQLLRSSSRPLTAQAISEELEVAKRTVYRDIVSLQAMRVPIDGEAGVGYVMRPGFDLPPLMFTSEEIEAIAVGVSMLGRTGDKALQRSANGVVRKVAQVLSTDSRNGFADLSVFTSKWHSIAAGGVDPRVLRQSVREEWKLEIKYKDSKGTSTTRVIFPLAVIYYIEVVVVASWCELREELRHFRVDRISACRSMGESFSEVGQSLRAKWRTENHME